MKSKVTYRQQYTRCGKQRCRKCKEGPGHGPYWYAFYSEGGRTVSKYIGIHAPADLDASRSRAPELAEAYAPEMASPAKTESTTSNPAEGTAQTSKSNFATPDEHTNDDDGLPLLRIYVLGHFRIERRNGDEWVPVTNRTWQRRRARALLGCLLSSSNRRVGREQAMEALWPEMDIETAANRLNGAVHEVRQVLEPDLSRPAASRMLRLERDMLTLANASLIWVDAEAFEKLLNKINTLSEPEQIEQAIENALSLYNGDYLLEELYSEWAAPRRESLRRSWMGLLLKLAELRAARGAFTSAIEPLDRLLTSDPTHETAVRRLMELLTQLDRRGEAFRVYQRLVDTLRREYETEPLPETVALYRALRQGTYQAPQAASPTLQQAPTRTQEQQRSPLQVPTFPRPVLQLGRHNQSKLVGRDEELAAMQRFLGVIAGLAQEQKGRGKVTHLLLLMGESGIGKTRLAEELSNDADQRGWSVVWAHGYEQESTIPYRPWAEIFRALLKNIPPALLVQGLEAQTKRADGEDTVTPGHSASTAQVKLARLSALVPELGMLEMLAPARARDAFSPTPEQERLHLWEAATAVLGLLSLSAPLLVVLDDLHWTDDSSLALLAYIVRHMQHERIAIMATCRDIELSPGSNLSGLLNDLRREQSIIPLAVKPLNETSISSLIAHLPEQIAKGILLQAGGNPFFAEELARISESGQLGALAGADRPQNIQGTALELDIPGAAGQAIAATATPESIKAVLDRRLSKLSSDCQLLLSRAAILGGSFSLSQLTFLTGEQGGNEESIFDLLEEALRAGLLTEEGAGARITYHFWHPLIVSHLYERQSAARRAQLHRKAAHALRQEHRGNEEEVAATITYHLIRGGSDLAQIAHYAELAGNRAFTLYAYSEAEHYYRVAADALTRDTPVQEINDPLHLASILERIAECNNVHGNFEETRRHYERVLELRNLRCSRAGRGMSAEEAQRQALIWGEIGKAWGENGNVEGVMRCYELGKQVMLDAGVTFGAAWAALYLDMGNLDWKLGNNNTARDYGQKALAILEQVMHQQEKQELPVSSTELPTSTALAMIGSPYELGRCHLLLGIVAATIGEFNEALEHLNKAQAIFEQHDLVTALTLVYGNLAAVFAMKSEYETARTYFRRALEMAKRANNLPSMAFVYGNLGDTAARCGNLVEAQEQLLQSISLAEQINDPEQASWSHTVLASALCDRGNMTEALTHIRLGLKIGRSIKNVLCIGMALIALGDWRITRAIQLHLIRGGDAARDSDGYRLLRSATMALQRALALEGLNAEASAEGRLTLASALYLLGEVETAHQVAMQSLKEARQHELLRVIARTQRLLGRIRATQGHHQEAEVYFEQAIETFAHHEMRLDYARTLHGYGITLLQRDRPGSDAYQRGLSYLHEAGDIFAMCGATIEAAAVERVLADPTYQIVGV